AGSPHADAGPPSKLNPPNAIGVVSVGWPGSFVDPAISRSQRRASIHGSGPENSRRAEAPIREMHSPSGDSQKKQGGARRLSSTASRRKSSWVAAPGAEADPESESFIVIEWGGEATRRV